MFVTLQKTITDNFQVLNDELMDSTRVGNSYNKDKHLSLPAVGDMELKLS